MRAALSRRACLQTGPAVQRPTAPCRAGGPGARSPNPALRRPAAHARAQAQRQAPAARCDRLAAGYRAAVRTAGVFGRLRTSRPHPPPETHRTRLRWLTGGARTGCGHGDGRRLKRCTRTGRPLHPLPIWAARPPARMTAQAPSRPPPHPGPSAHPPGPRGRARGPLVPVLAAQRIEAAVWTLKARPGHGPPLAAGACVRDRGAARRHPGGRSGPLVGGCVPVSGCRRPVTAWPGCRSSCCAGLRR